MASKLEQIKQLVQQNGTEKMKEVVLIAENYILGLNHIFRDRDVTQFVLQEFDLPMFIKELGESGKFENKSGLQVKILILDIYSLARHLWEFTDERGQLKTGDDLHKAWPSFFPDAEMKSVEDVYNKNLRYM